MNKRLTNQNAGQKKPPHHVGEDRDGVLLLIYVFETKVLISCNVHILYHIGL